MYRMLLQDFIALSLKYDHITPILIHILWLPVESRIQIKIFLMIYKALNGLAPVHLQTLLQLYTRERHLRSSTAFLLNEKRFHLQSYGARSFSVAATLLWNKLPLNIKNCSSDLLQIYAQNPSFYISISVD